MERPRQAAKGEKLQNSEAAECSERTNAVNMDESG